MNHLEILKSKADENYIDFIHKLIPTADRDFFIGVRTPELRKILKENKDDDDFVFGLLESKFKFYEERLLFSFYINELESFEDTFIMAEEYFCYCNNWALADSLRPKSWKNRIPEVKLYLDEWFKDERLYVKRFVIGIYMYYCLGEDFRYKDFKKITNLKTDEYYLEMMIAWYIAEVFVKHKKYALDLLERKSLSKSIQNKAIQKAVDSRRISTADKEYLKTLRI